jgi:hypothetical protein
MQFFSRNQSEFKLMLVPLEKSAGNLGLQINREKTKYIATNKRGARGGLQIDFKYLGSFITTVKEISVDINARLATGKDLLISKLLLHKLKIWLCEINAQRRAESDYFWKKDNPYYMWPSYQTKRYHRVRSNQEIHNTLANNADIIVTVKTSHLRWLVHGQRLKPQSSKEA